MARHTRADHHGEDAVPNARSASDLLRAAGYDLPESRRRRRERAQEPTQEPTLPPAAERMMFPYRRDADVDRTGERTQPARPPGQRPQPARTEPSRPDPVRPDLARPHPPRPAGVGSDPVRPDLARPLPPRPAGVGSDPVRPDLARPLPPRPAQVGPDPVRPGLRPDPLRSQPSRGERPRSERTEPAFPQRTPPAGWRPELTGPQTGPQTGPHTWPPLGSSVPVRVPVPPDLDEPTHLAPVQPLPRRYAPQPAPVRLASAAAAAPLVRTLPPKRPVQPEYDERPLDRRAARPVTEPVDDEGNDDAPERSLFRAWVVFLVETLVAAGLGLGLWLGFHTLWRTQPLLAAGGSGVVLVGLHVTAGWIRRRQTGGELDLFSSAVIVAVGVAITVLPAAFTIHPG